MSLSSAEYYCAWLVISLCGVASFVYFLLKRYSHKTMIPFSVKVLTFTGWFLGLATISILPLDISLANLSHSNGPHASITDMEYIL